MTKLLNNAKNAIVLNGKKIATAVTVGGSMLAGSAMAAGDDYSGVLTGLDSTTVVTALVAAGAVYAGPGFAKWATKKVAGFFG